MMNLCGFTSRKLFEKLVAVCEKAVAVQPDDVCLLTELGNAQLRQAGLWKPAVFLKNSPGSKKTIPIIGAGWAKRFLPPGALDGEAAFLRAGSLDPEQMDRYYFRIADLYMRDKRHDEAMRFLKRCISFNPSQPLYSCSLGD